MRINTGLPDYSIDAGRVWVKLGQIEALIEYMVLWILVAFMVGLAIGILLGAAWPSTH